MERDSHYVIASVHVPFYNMPTLPPILFKALPKVTSCIWQSFTGTLNLQGVVRALLEYITARLWVPVIECQHYTLVSTPMKYC